MRVPIGERLVNKIDKPDGEAGCWVWTSTRDHLGYGRFQIGKSSTPAHRVTYEHFVGPIDPGLTIDHLCRNRACVNPAHLEPVTHRENVLRGTSFAATNAAKTHCLRGHALNAENVYVKKNGGRQCIPCLRLSQARYRDKHRASESTADRRPA